MDYKIKTQDTGVKQMIILIEPATLVNLKHRALERNISLKAWVLQAIAEKMHKEDMANK